jgi:UDP-2-acetamido-3-amino-2,3-dideoxy-glucuronate N-acetyltransferase
MFAMNERTATSVPGVTLVQLPQISDWRGNLTFMEFPGLLPFQPRRMFMLYNVPSQDIRGEHAHRELHQFLICVQGSCSVVVENEKDRSAVHLDKPTLGLHIPPMIWATEYRFTQDAVLVVLASDVYKPEDYIRSYDEYLDLLTKR